MSAWEAADGSRINVDGLMYGVLKGRLNPDDIEASEGGVLIRGKFYEQLE